MKMTFETALMHLKQGARIRRATWMDGECLSLVKTFRGGYVTRSPYAPFVLNDILANDLEVMEEKEGHDGSMV